MLNNGWLATLLAANKTLSRFAESSSGDDIADGLGETSGDDFVNNGLESSEGDGDNVAKDILLNSLTLLVLVTLMTFLYL